MLARFWREHRLVLLAIWAALAAFGVVNALSVAHDRAGQVQGWEPWVWEGTSALGWTLLSPLVGWLALHLRPPRTRWPGATAAHLGASTLVSAAHVAAMVGLRTAIYAARGLAYGFVFDAPTLAYEYRKDVLTYAAIVLVFLGVDAVRRSTRGVAPAPPQRAQLVVRDGARTHLLDPVEIGWAQAAGNYVELMTVRGPILHRTSLSALEARLAGDGFVRVHRSRLVRTAAIRAVETDASGDFDLLLEDGARVGGSRRFRAALPAYTKL